MELHELGDRLLRLHAKLIIVVILAGVLGGLAVQWHDKHQYQASALFTMGVADPQSAQIAGVLADTARGIATGPQLVAQAISDVGVRRDENSVAAAISIQTMGSSGVLALSVKDQDPRVAVGLANALADRVVSTRARLLQNGKASSFHGLGQQEAATQAQIKQVSAQIEQLATQSSPVAIAQLSALEARLTSLQDVAAQITVQQNNLVAQQGPQTTVIDRAVSAVSIPRRTLDNALLGGVLGLVVGIALAAAREVIRPSLVGAALISRTIGAPLLGEMSTPPDTWTLSALPDAGSYIELAAEAKHVEEVRFAALEPKGRRRAQVRMLEGPLRRLRFSGSRIGEPWRVSADHGSGAEVTPVAAVTVSPDGDSDGGSSPCIGLVVAVPRVLKAADVEAVTNFVWISGWVLLGVIVHSSSRRAIVTARRGSGSADSGRVSSVAQQTEVDAW